MGGVMTRLTPEILHEAIDYLTQDYVSHPLKGREGEKMIQRLKNERTADLEVFKERFDNIRFAMKTQELLEMRPVITGYTETIPETPILRE
jgi:hypothetical protein